MGIRVAMCKFQTNNAAASLRTESETSMRNICGGRAGCCRTKVHTAHPARSSKGSACMQHAMVVVNDKVARCQLESILMLGCSYNARKRSIRVVPVQHDVERYVEWCVGEVRVSNLEVCKSRRVISSRPVVCQNWRCERALEGLLSPSKCHGRCRKLVECKWIGVPQVLACCERIYNRV
jgi:hypothetical protein